MKAIQQITLRLPQDLAQRLAASTPARKRNQFVANLVRQELDRASRELEQAAQRLTLLESGTKPEDLEWLALENAPADGGHEGSEFDEALFLQELAAREAAAASNTPTSAPTSAAIA